MHKKIALIILGLFLFASAFPVHAKKGQASIRLFDRQAKEISSIIDGNLVQLSIKLDAPVSDVADVSFFLDVNQFAASCTILSGEDTCKTDPFSALGWYWNSDETKQSQRTISAQIDENNVAGSLQVTVKPRPVVMVHGFISNWDVWKPYLGESGYLASIGLQGFAVGDGQAPGVLNTGSVSDPRARTNTIAQNAEVLGKYIAGVQQKTGAEKVDLLVHSMGGMIARYYIDRVMTSENVAQVIFLGTPMAGSTCVFPLAALGFMLPASLEIQPGYMSNIFNNQIIHRHGIPFHMLSGTFITDSLASPCAEAPSDSVVARDSTTSITLDSQDDMTIYHGDMTSDPGVFDTVVRPLLQAPPGSFDAPPDPDLDSSSSVVNTPEQFSRAYTGHLSPGQTALVTIQIDPNVTLANFSLYDSSRSLDMEVHGANGNLIQLDAQKNGMLKLDDPRTMIYLGYGFAQPKPGAWRVELKTTSQTPTSGADYAVNARYTGGTRLEARVSQTIVNIGRAVAFTSRLQGNGVAVTPESAVALIRKPDGSSETLTPSLQAGVFKLSYQPQLIGLYNVEFSVAGRTASGAMVERAAYLSFETQSVEEQVQRANNSWSTLVLIVLLTVALILVSIVKRRLKRYQKLLAEAHASQMDSSRGESASSPDIDES